MPLAEPIVRNTDMREAARFVAFLRTARNADWRSAGLADWSDAYGASDDRGRFTAVVEHVTGLDIEWCDDCSRPQWYWTWHGHIGDVGADLCVFCRGELFWCDDCGVYSREQHDHDEDEDGEVSSECEARHLSFDFPLGDSFVQSDVRFTVATPAGQISQPGMQEIGDWLRRNTQWGYGAETHLLTDFEPFWQTKSGNFTKRLAKLYLQHGYKLSSEDMSQVGNLARQHTSEGKSYELELTRDLNQSAADFLYAGSCWWGSESAGRCALKQCGGLGIRSFGEGGMPLCGNPNCTVCDKTKTDDVNGRAWLMPLDTRPPTTSLRPTHDTEAATAFVLFNAYGLDGFEFARIVAQMTGKSYRKIEFTCSPMYVNNDRAFLIADESTCQRNDSLSFRIHRECDCR